MKPYLQRVVCQARNDVALLVEISFHTNTTYNLRALDFKGNLNALLAVEADVEKHGLLGWYGRQLDDGTYTYHEKIVSNKPGNFATVNYRAVDPLHIDSLMSLVTSTLKHSVEKLDGRMPCHLIHGYAALPGNFILADAYNKVVHNANFDPDIGDRMVTESLGRKTRDKLFELEGYRLMRTLNTLDDLLGSDRHAIELRYVPACMANQMPFIETTSGVVYVVPPRDLEYPTDKVTQPNYAANVMEPGCYFVPANIHMMLRGIIGSYIETRI